MKRVLVEVDALIMGGAGTYIVDNGAEYPEFFMGTFVENGERVKIGDYDQRSDLDEAILAFLNKRGVSPEDVRIVRNYSDPTLDDDDHGAGPAFK